MRVVPAHQAFAPQSQPPAALVEAGPVSGAGQATAGRLAPSENIPVAPQGARLAPVSAPRGRRSRPTVVIIGGLIWSGLLLGTVNSSPLALGVVVTPVALIAVISASRRAVRALDETTSKVNPVLLGVLVAIGAAPLVAVFGPIVLAVWLAVGAGLAVWLQRAQPSSLTWRSVAASVLPALAGGSLVLAARQGAEIAIVLVVAVCLFDVANAAMGSGPTGGVVGAISGILTVGVFAVIVEAIMAPPFTGFSPWLLCGAVAVLAPLGVWVCGVIAPGRLPALRRLDSLVFAAPVWAAGVALLLH